MPAGSVVRVDRPIDTEAFARLIATRFHVTLQHVVTTDIDRDGDLDIVASTDRGFLVWVNDGAGRLTSQPPRHAPAVDGSEPGDTWQGGRSRADETIQNNLPSPRLSGSYTSAPPNVAGRRAASVDAEPAATTVRTAKSPRAPPSSC